MYLTLSHKPGKESTLIYIYIYIYIRTNKPWVWSLSRKGFWNGGQRRQDGDVEEKIVGKREMMKKKRRRRQREKRKWRGEREGWKGHW
jgi:hypothetical protein